MGGLRFLLVAGLALFISSCATVPGFEMYPTPLTPTQKVASNQAIILVGSSGPGGVSYVQFLHSGMPAINVRQPFSSEILAVPMTVGIKQLKVHVYTATGQGSGYIGSMSFGYNTVKSVPVDIDRPGIYYLGTIQPAHRQVVPDPDSAQLSQLREKYKASFEGLEPVNFRWP
jgi:hypothetical protein